ncbi:hypothetical protein GCM10011490_07670 [Pseudoclavibacter endophyticus]|uniref:DUF4352 domain-containing protein n=1 Tax=Pseudoclavibacter endophyticus TaxID=1778590 RepID=A0A6H9WS53_9MICO|nr:hypothetical protein [Pseudoclavibacter endophyticus]KAB1649757.1 hypothetical protein F8O04_05845 [Pseudoclavibacter endophyticus]GGA59985.1 hypothetical protein GCM10011490_07670 [Pseudoclavibacter endophyticus]
MNAVRIVVAVAVAGLLSGCTLVTHLGEPQAEEPPETTAAQPEDPTGHTPDPTEAGETEEPIVPPDVPDDAPDRINVQLELGVPHDIIGKEGEVVGTITVTNVDDDTTCPSTHADESKYGKFVIASFELTAEESLVDQSDSWYGRNFDLSTIDVIDPFTGISLSGGLDYDCLPPADRLSTVQPGNTESGALAYDVADELFAIGWFYGHQYFYVPPSVWGGL